MHSKLTLALSFFVALVVAGVNQNDLFGLGECANFDFVLGASDLDVADDGLLVFAGATSDTLADVTVGWLRTVGDFGSDDVSPEGLTGRFTAIFTGLTEGGYVVHATQGKDSIFQAVGQIGVR